MITLPDYNQYDPKWKDKPLGSSLFKMGDSGCYVTTFASILAGSFKKKNASGQPLTPGDLCDMLNANNGFTAEGQMIWGILEKLFPDLLMYKACYSTNAGYSNVSKVMVEKVIGDIKRSVALGIPIGIIVDNLYNDKIPDHIVACFDAPDNLADWMIMDPDSGRTMRFVDKYGSPMTGVMGFRQVIGPPTSFPSYSGSFEASAGAAAWKAAQVYKGKNVQVYSKEILDSLMGY
jgi:hypothetical protein